MPPYYYTGGFLGTILGGTVGKIISFIYHLIMFILTIVILVYVTKNRESFIMRGQSYTGGQMIYGDVPEKVSAGGEEYDNPLYEEISRGWEPTDKKVNGYTVWKQKD